MSLADNQAPGLKINIRGRLSKTAREKRRRRKGWKERQGETEEEWKQRRETEGDRKST